MLIWIAIFGRPDAYLSRAMDGLTALTGISGRTMFGTVRDWLDGVDTEAVAAPAPRGQADVSAVVVPGSPKLDTRSVERIALAERTIGTSSCSSDAGSNFGDVVSPPSPAPGHDPAASGVSPAQAASAPERHTSRT